MRCIGASILRLPGATALIAGAAILSAAASPPERPQTPSYEEALAIPRVLGPGGNEVALPQPLPPSEAARIRLILRLQDRGDLTAAARETGRLDTSTNLGHAMLGYVLADRHLGRHGHTAVEELGRWLELWPGLPDAIPVHALLVARLPRGTPSPVAPVSVTLPAPSASDVPATAPVPEEMGMWLSGLSRNGELDRDVRDRARRGEVAGVMTLLRRTRGLAPGYASQLAGEAARDLFTSNRDEDALKLGASGAAACGRGNDCQVAALAPYMAGLAAWRLDRPELAMTYFEQAWRAGLTTAAQRAGAAFWAARAHLRRRDDQYATWLNRAAAERVTFYGQIARRMLADGGDERELAERPAREVLTEADVDAIAATDQGLRAFALLQVGERPRAEAEMRQLWPRVQGDPALARAVMLVADRAGLSSLATQLADLLQAADGQPREATRFRIPKLRPDGGFRVDPAIVYALARTESDFDSECLSSAGAVGIMQIMPETAQLVLGLGGRKVDPHGRWVTQQLHDPSANLDLGQRYVAYLAETEAVDGDLMRLLASYNAGPARVEQWNAMMRDRGDPLLFVEALPLDETRAYVPRVLTYTWIYAARLRLPTPSLDELAAGGWPRFHPLGARGEPAGRLH